MLLKSFVKVNSVPASVKRLGNSAVKMLSSDDRYRPNEVVKQSVGVIVGKLDTNVYVPAVSKSIV